MDTHNKSFPRRKTHADATTSYNYLFYGSQFYYMQAVFSLPNSFTQGNESSIKNKSGLENKIVIKKVA